MNTLRQSQRGTIFHSRFWLDQDRVKQERVIPVKEGKKEGSDLSGFAS